MAWGRGQQEAVMIEDRIDNNIIPAKLLGMYTIWVKQGFGQYWNIKKKDEEPDCIVNGIDDICNYLLQERGDYER